jgi:hypothetical protein
MEGQQFVNPDLYAQQVAQASGGAMPAAGMAPYPLYGIPPLGQTTPTAVAAEVPVYRRNWFWALVGAGTVGAAWAYFGWWRGRGMSPNRSGGSWEHLPSGVWQMRHGDESVLMVFGGGDSWDWQADYSPEGGRYRVKRGSARSLDAAKRAAEQWTRRASVGSV